MIVVPRRTRWLLYLTPLLLFAPPGFLLAQLVPDRTDTPFMRAGLQATPVPILLPIEPLSRNIKKAVAIITTTDVAALTAHQGLALVVATYGLPAKLLEGTLTVDGTNCTYDTEAGAALVNNGRLYFRGSPACRRDLQGTAKGLRLEVQYRGDGGLALWAAMPNQAAPENAMRLTFPIVLNASDTPLVQGTFVDAYRGVYSRAELLAYMWRGTTSTAWIWCVVGAAGLLMMIAVAGVMRAGSLRPAATFAAMLSLGLLYAVIVPPFQAADEPSHFLTFARGTAQPNLVEEAEALGRLTHFERIRFNPHERFRTANLHDPLDRRWSSVSEQDLRRSPAAIQLWRALATLLPPMAAPVCLFVLRVANAALLALALAAVARAGWAPADDFNGALPLLIIPTLPFFGMHVSNHALLTCANVMIAGAAAVGLWRPQRWREALLLLVSAQALAIGAGRLALGQLPLTASIGVALILLNRARRLQTVAEGPAHWSPWRRAAAAAAGIAAAIPVLLIAGSLLFSYPAMTPAAALPPDSLKAYVVRAISVVATFPRLTGTDLLLSETFWGGFGWLDAYPPSPLVPLLVASTSASLSALFFSIARRGDMRQFGWMILLAVGFFASVAAIAAGSYLYSPDLHGRYLLGAYIPAVAVAWSIHIGRRGVALVALGSAVHALCLSALLLRYW